MSSFLRAPALGPLLALALVAPRAHAQQAPAGDHFVPPPAPLAPPILEVTTEDGALEQRTPQEDDDDGWTVRCQAPCTVQARQGLEYRLKGDGNRPSPVFRAGADGSRTVIKGHVGSKASLISGIVLTGVGTFAVLIGTLVIASAGEPHDESAAPGVSDDQVRLRGALVGAGGLAMAGAGVALWLNGRTSIQLSTSPASPPTLSLRLTDRLLLTPEGLRF